MRVVSQFDYIQNAEIIVQHSFGNKAWVFQYFAQSPFYYVGEKYIAAIWRIKYKA